MTASTGIVGGGKAAALNEVLYAADKVDWEQEDSILTGMTSLAICGIEDPVRPEVRHSLLRTITRAYQ